MMPADPSKLLTAFAPPNDELLALARLDAPESGPESLDRTRIMPPPLPEMGPGAPDWMRAARAMADSFERCIQRGTVDPTEQAAIERAWMAWTMGGITPRHVLRVIKLVSHAHRAVVTSPPSRVAAVIEDCATLVYNGLPSSVRSNVPYDRVRGVVWKLSQTGDPWIAIVESTVELLGWKDYAQSHAASILRAIIDRE
jgi:hypothetical protein